jgi:E3 ubiquitin-protein ligase BOI and related proteins
LGNARRRQYGWLLGAAGATGVRRIREKEAEASEAALRGVEMEERIARLRGEAKALQAKALADQATAAAQAQRARRCKAEEEEGAAGSCFVDPDQLVVEVAAPARPCRTCGRRSSSVVLLLCRHLCVCAACEPAVSPGGAAACPMCRGAVTETLQVFFS